MSPLGMFIATAVTFAAIGALIVLVEWSTRRRHRRLAQLFSARGLKVVKIRATSLPSFPDQVDYIGPQGDLRRATMPRGRRATEPSDDQPFELVLRNQYRSSRSPGGDMLAKLKLAAAHSELPGWNEWTSLALQLAAGESESATIEESAASPESKWRFVPILQCIEAMNITSKDGAEQVLELVADGKNIDIHWSVDGVSPHRILRLTQRKRGNAETYE